MFSFLWLGNANIFVVAFLAVGAVDVEVKAVGAVNLSAARTNVLAGSNSANVRRNLKRIGLIFCIFFNYDLWKFIVLVFYKIFNLKFRFSMSLSILCTTVRRRVMPFLFSRINKASCRPRLSKFGQVVCSIVQSVGE